MTCDHKIDTSYHSGAVWTKIVKDSTDHSCPGPHALDKTTIKEQLMRKLMPCYCFNSCSQLPRPSRRVGILAENERVYVTRQPWRAFPHTWGL